MEIYLTEGLINYSAKSTRRVDLTFSVGYENDIAHVKDILSKIVENDELILKDPQPFIGVSAHSASSIDFVVRVWCNTGDYWNIYHSLLEEVKITFDKENNKYTLSTNGSSLKRSL